MTYFFQRFACVIFVLIFTVLHRMQMRSSNENSVCLSLCLSVKRMIRDTWKKELPDFYTV